MISVLIADDDTDDIELFCEAIQEIDPAIKCIRTENGLEVFQFLASANELPKLIFLDINMPRMNGWECLSKLKGDEMYSHIPIIMSSTSNSEKDGSVAINMGAMCFFTKPFHYDELLNILSLLVLNSDNNLNEAISEFNKFNSRKIIFKPINQL